MYSYNTNTRTTFQNSPCSRIGQQNHSTHTYTPTHTCTAPKFANKRPPQPTHLHTHRTGNCHRAEIEKKNHHTHTPTHLQTYAHTHTAPELAIQRKSQTPSGILAEFGPRRPFSTPLRPPPRLPPPTPAPSTYRSSFRSASRYIWTSPSTPDASTTGSLLRKHHLLVCGGGSFSVDFIRLHRDSFSSLLRLVVLLLLLLVLVVGIV